MSTFKDKAARIVDILIPEFKWQALDGTQYEQIFEKLFSTEALQPELMRHTRKRKPGIGFHHQYRSGGGWTAFGNITLRPGEDPLDPYVLSLILHETFHLQQSILTRLSMQGELLAWQYQAQTYLEIAFTQGNRIGMREEAYGRGRETYEFWDELMQLSADSRADLEQARAVMQKISPGYRSDALPLYPLHREIWFYLKQGRFKDILDVIRKLILASG